MNIGKTVNRRWTKNSLKWNETTKNTTGRDRYIVRIHYLNFHIEPDTLHVTASTKFDLFVFVVGLLYITYYFFYFLFSCIKILNIIHDWQYGKWEILNKKKNCIRRKCIYSKFSAFFSLRNNACAYVSSPRQLVPQFMFKSLRIYLIILLPNKANT